MPINPTVAIVTVVTVATVTSIYLSLQLIRNWRWSANFEIHC